MKPLFIKKNGTVSKVSGIVMNLIPSYTLAEYNALTHKPLLWVRTDEDYAQIPSEDVSYGSGSVKDALDELNQNPKFKKLWDTKTALSTSASVPITLPESRNNYTFLYLVVGFDAAQKRAVLIVTAEHNNSFPSGYVDDTNLVIIQDVYSSSPTALNLHQKTNTASTLNLYKVYGIK